VSFSGRSWPQRDACAHIQFACPGGADRCEPVQSGARLIWDESRHHPSFDSQNAAGPFATPFAVNQVMEISLGPISHRAAEFNRAHYVIDYALPRTCVTMLRGGRRAGTYYSLGTFSARG
jgi:hypothetical protein